MNILALDTSDQVLSVALATGSGLWYSEIDSFPRHSELLMECVDTICNIAGLGRQDLERLACMKGPGSFTGLRIGFSAAKGLAMALGIPLLSLPTLDCLAYSLSIWPGMVIPVIDAKKDCFFAAIYRGGKRLTDYLDLSVEDLAKEAAKLTMAEKEQIVITGSGAELLFPRLTAFIPQEQIRLDPGFRKGRARELLEMAKSIILEKSNDIDSGPLYIRKSDAELNKA